MEEKLTQGIVFSYRFISGYVSPAHSHRKASVLEMDEPRTAIRYFISSIGKIARKLTVSQLFRSTEPHKVEQLFCCAVHQVA